LIGHDHPNKPANGERMIRQSVGARSDAKPDSTFADRALE
jgi:hypothetical protein